MSVGVHGGQRRTSDPPGAGVRSIYEMSGMGAGEKPGSVEEQQVLLTCKPSISLTLIYFVINRM